MGPLHPEDLPKDGGGGRAALQRDKGVGELA